MRSHLWQLCFFIHTPIEIDRRPAVNVVALPEVDHSRLILRLRRDLPLAAVIILCHIRLNKSFFKCLYVNRAVFEAVRPLYHLRHPLFRLAAAIEKLLHDLPVLRALVGVHHVLGAGRQRLEYVSAVGRGLSILFRASLRFLGLVYASPVIVGYLLEPHAPLLPQFLEAVEDLLVIKRAGLPGAPSEEGQTVRCVPLSGALRGRDQLVISGIEEISLDELSIELRGLRGSFAHVV